MLGPGGWEYIERVCARLPGLAVVVCTGPSSVAQRVRGLRLGADAWMTKPLPRRGVDLRGRGGDAPSSPQRRCPRLEAAARFGEITIRPDLYQAYAGEASLELTAREFEILHLLSGSDRVLRREEIYERVWGYAMAHGDRSVDVFVRKLRQKLRTASPDMELHPHAFRRRLPLRPGARERRLGPAEVSAEDPSCGDAGAVIERAPPARVESA